MGNVRGVFMKPLLSIFTAPKGEDVNGFFEAYDQLLGGYSDKVLSDAVKRIIASRDKRTFPLPYECSHACRDALAALAAAKHANERSDDNHHENAPLEQRYPEWSELRKQQAWSLMRCELGKEAARDMWIIPLYDFCRENRRLPDVHEVTHLVEKGKKTGELVGLLQETESGTEFAATIKNKAQRFYFARHNTICKKIGADEFVFGA